MLKALAGLPLLLLLLLLRQQPIALQHGQAVVLQPLAAPRAGLRRRARRPRSCASRTPGQRLEANHFRAVTCAPLHPTMACLGQGRGTEESSSG